MVIATSAPDRASARRPISSTGLSLWRGQVYEEWLKDLEILSKRLKVYKQMRRDLTIATALDAVKGPLLAADIDVTPGGDSSIDQDAADFLYGVLGDMTVPWVHHIEDGLEMLDFGFSLGEMVFKRRLGLDGPDGPSDYTDGLIGLSEVSPIAQETVAAALTPWDLDRHGNLLSVSQVDPVTLQRITIPGWKVAHFVFRSRKRNPEGDSILADLFRAWRYRTNFEELEGIGVERDVGGTPVLYTPRGVSSTDEAEVDKQLAGLRNDEEAFIRFRGPKQSAENQDGYLLESYQSASKAYDVGAIIERYDKAILMRFFAQFLKLGMDKVGTQALVQGSQDFFGLSLRRIQLYMMEVWNGNLVPLLFRLNGERFAGITALPKFHWSDPGKPDLQALINLYREGRSSDILTITEADEDHLRNVSGLPDRQPGIGEGVREKPGLGLDLPPAAGFAKFKAPDEPKPAAGQDVRTRGGWLDRATNAYQRDLVAVYDQWSARAAKAIANAQRDGLAPMQQAAILDALMADLEADLIQAGRLKITDAVFDAMRGPFERYRGAPEMLAALQENLVKNEQFVRTSLLPEVRQRLAQDILAGIAEDNQALRATFERLRYRPAQYAGGLYQSVLSVSATVGKVDDQVRANAGLNPARVRWDLDPTADHCADDPVRGTFGCPGLAGEYASWAALPGVPGEITTCRGNDRCTLSVWVEELQQWHRIG